MALLQQATGDVVEAAETLEKMVWPSMLSWVASLPTSKVPPWDLVLYPVLLRVILTLLFHRWHQLDLASTQGNLEKQREYLWRVADAYDKAGYLDIAETHLKELLSLELSKEQKLEALCFLADVQVPTFLTPIHDSWLLWGCLDTAGSTSTSNWGGLMCKWQCLLIPYADED